MSITVERSDGGKVDAELIRPRSWILESGLCAGRMLPLNLPELEVSGLALVTAIDNCPPIAGGEGSVVTARFVTREVHVVANHYLPPLVNSPVRTRIFKTGPNGSRTP